MSKNKPAVAITIAYQGEIPFFAVQEFIPGKDESLSLSLKESSMTEIKSLVKQYDDYEDENSLEKDLAFMKQFADEKKRKKRIKADNEFMGRLWQKTYPCCGYHVKIFN